uniref:Retrotransposon gag domain-containing protein n=1 Tax=Tanacetum cinerariifolium TaxID=118510 RepID=A0A699GHH5_TANCI|nr:hypothetical protein [Tanacetum cinerariifolium]
MLIFRKSFDEKIAMAAPDLKGTHAHPFLSSPNPTEPKSNISIEISTEIIMKLRNNVYNGIEGNDTIDHITRFIPIIGLVKTPKVNTEQLRVLAFLYSLTGEAHRWWVQEGNSKITSWEKIVDKFFYKHYLLSCASKTNNRECHLRFINWLNSKFKNPRKLSSATQNALWNFWEKGYNNDTLIDDYESSDDESSKSNHHPSFDPCQNEKEVGDKSHQKECKDSPNMHENFDTTHSNMNEQQDGRMCKMDRFEVIKYSIRDNEEFLGVCAIEHQS